MLKMIIDDYEALIAEVANLCKEIFQKIFSLEEINHSVRDDESPDFMFSSQDIPQFTQASLNEKEHKDLRRVTFNHLKRENPDKTPSVIDKILLKDFIIDSADSLFYQLQAKNLTIENERTLWKAWTSYLDSQVTPGLKRVITSQLLIFQPATLDTVNWVEMQKIILMHLDDHNEFYNLDNSHSIFPSEIFTYLQLRESLGERG
ncbi:hypothetical protein EMCG_00149 [[Emmonsia] crescens]|uniref:Uncharacterized protein n=1 Tax=[Emmonsia] crescens TaxID=73230 RepID=A0A0G2IDM2_9EURO|nr:hypothetical protein EMCG_00149 [Emmonsia crescens UAMH 3008]